MTAFLLQFLQPKPRIALHSLSLSLSLSHTHTHTSSIHRSYLSLLQILFIYYIEISDICLYVCMYVCIC
ncbi:hypothetical protein LOK49_LG04G03872 [Camellia lanceoleosa]|uniref:Uncharacterized protein n=1 Tax=Camellia lanceoleosa TaxID=1840588 RepID=A0ACC0I0V3_9ERIC|nr:hypothetical protein LOK49_LG04G03872 [Camellia lanceoleosa]